LEPRGGLSPVRKEWEPLVAPWKVVKKEDVFISLCTVRTTYTRSRKDEQSQFRQALTSGIHSKIKEFQAYPKSKMHRISEGKLEDQSEAEIPFNFDSREEYDDYLSFCRDVDSQLEELEKEWDLWLSDR
jgi:hypothetical protein